MIGQMISHYKILEKLGEGGMGVVYKAQDTKLNRFVALKFLPEHVSSSADDAARFVQEAQAAAALNHPNICTIYGIDEADNRHFIVMEFVDGQTLQEKKTSLSLKQAIDIGIQIAEGLTAAHEKGIVHRDIKPENIMIRKDGIVQIMDFGLAKLRGASRLTKEGSTVGTAGYMSPEQVQGQDADHRSDIFSLGVLLFEMMTKQLPFRGAHETAIAYEIVNVDSPPMSSINPEISPELDAIVLECLEKDPKERTQSAGQVALDLKRFRRESSRQRASRIVAASSVQAVRGHQANSESGPMRGPGGISRKPLIVAGAIALVTLGVMAWWKPWSNQTPDFTRPVHFSFDIPAKSSQILNWENVLQISPDGKSIAYTDLSGPNSIIDIRDISDVVAYPVRGTEGVLDPVFENSNWLTFSAHSVSWKIPLTGGVPDISQPGHGYINGLSWGANGELVFAKTWSSGLTIQSGWNEKESVLTEVDAAKNEGTHMLPCILPGDKAALFTIWSKEGTFDDSKIAVVNLITKERRNLSYNGVDLQGTSPRLLQTPWENYLLWSRNGNLYASSFDLSDLKVTGPEIKILEGLSVNASSGKAAYAVTNANNGTLTYMPGKLDTAKTVLMWINRNGTEANVVSTGPYQQPSMSKDGRALIILTGPVYKVGSVNFKQGKVDLLFGDGDNNLPRITPDGSSFIFVSNFENGKYNVYLSRLDGIGGVKKIVATEGGYPEISNVSPDGRCILYNPYPDSSKIWIKELTNNREPKLLFQAKSKDASPMFSPDGKLLAYRSDEIDGKFRLFVRPFPITDSKVQVSIDDGYFPQWSADGTQLYYRDGDKIMAASIQTKPELQVLSHRLVCSSIGVSGSTSQSDFAVAPDGRILLLRSAVEQSKPVKVNVILNWFTELKKKLTNEN